MSRVPGGEIRTVPPTNNVYTALAAAAVIIQLIGVVAIWMKAEAVGGLL
jgi:hypothetical protein